MCDPSPDYHVGYAPPPRSGRATPSAARPLVRTTLRVSGDEPTVGGPGPPPFLPPHLSWIYFHRYSESLHALLEFDSDADPPRRVTRLTYPPSMEGIIYSNQRPARAYYRPGDVILTREMDEPDMRENILGEEGSVWMTALDNTLRLLFDVRPNSVKVGKFIRTIRAEDGGQGSMSCEWVVLLPQGRNQEVPVSLGRTYAYPSRLALSVDWGVGRGAAARRMIAQAGEEVAVWTARAMVSILRGGSPVRMGQAHSRAWGVAGAQASSRLGARRLFTASARATVDASRTFYETARQLGTRQDLARQAGRRTESDWRAVYAPALIRAAGAFVAKFIQEIVGGPAPEAWRSVREEVQDQIVSILWNNIGRVVTAAANAASDAAAGRGNFWERFVSEMGNIWQNLPQNALQDLGSTTANWMGRNAPTVALPPND